MNGIRRKVAITGIGQTAFSKASEHSAWELATQAILAALDDAGIEASEVDGLCRFAPPFEPVSEPMVVRGVGIRELTFFSEAPLGGDALGAVIGHAASAIVTGQANVVVAYRALRQSGGARYGRADQGPAGTAATGDDVLVGEEENRSFAWPYGFTSPGNVFALWATRYMHEHGLSEEDLATALGSVAVGQRRYASANPSAMMRDRVLDMPTYLDARMISWPLRLFDLCLESDGACAVVLTAADRARALRDDPVYVLSTTQTLAPYFEPMGMYTGDLLQSFPPAAAERLFAGAGVTRDDISVAELYDATSYMPMKSLESYGFVPKGTGWRHVIDAGIGPDAPLPVNTHGGHLSEAYIHGMNGVTEAVRQLRGTAYTQVTDADVALVATPSGSAMILAR